VWEIIRFSSMGRKSWPVREKTNYGNAATDRRLTLVLDAQRRGTQRWRSVRRVNSGCGGLRYSYVWMV
jgi:hypothetical protein